MTTLCPVIRDVMSCNTGNRSGAFIFTSNDHAMSLKTGNSTGAWMFTANDDAM